jgi:hypothetical protein
MNRLTGRRAALAALALSSAAALPKIADLPDRPELPDSLVMLDGTRVTTEADWFEKRRPELKTLFQHYMYGEMPPAVKVTSNVEFEEPNAFGGKATLKEIALHVGPAEVPPIHLLLLVPNRRRGPAPVFVGLNFSGNHSLVSDRRVRVSTSWMYPSYPGVKDHRATEAGRNACAESWSIEQSIDRGYAVATFYNGDVDPDRPDERGGLRPFLKTPGGATGAHETATIAAWAWGLHRAVDYLVADKDIDPKRIAAFGHSRLGKTALLAAAFDERIALAIPHQAGCGGTAPSRGKVGESVKQINDHFPHWFCGAFKEFNGRPERLPFDQHCLAALVAPRPLLFSNAAEDTWANPMGQFEVLAAAASVYRFLNAGDFDSARFPPLGTLKGGRLGYFMRPGKHSTTREDWKIFLDFADQHFRKQGATGGTGGTP